jgi:hypothetical protein
MMDGILVTVLVFIIPVSIWVLNLLPFSRSSSFPEFNSSYLPGSCAI